MAAAKKTEDISSIAIEIAPLDIRTIIVPVVGTSRLVTHPFGQKAREELLGTPGIKKKRAPRDPDAAYAASIYYTEDGKPAVPAIAFKRALVDAASQFDKSLTKVFLRGVFWIEGEFLPVKGTPQRREDVVRVGMGKPDIRWRAEYWPWGVDVPVRYNARNITVTSLLELFRMAGLAVGICENRPQRNGDWGMFDVQMEGAK